MGVRGPSLKTGFGFRWFAHTQTHNSCPCLSSASSPRNKQLPGVQLCSGHPAPAPEWSDKDTNGEWSQVRGPVKDQVLRYGKERLPCRNRAVWDLFPRLKRHQASGCCRLRSELMQNSFTQARPRATSGRAQTSRAWKTRGRAGRNTRSRVLSSR